MRRRVVEDRTSRLTIPPDIAAGPEVRRWAAPEALQVLDGTQTPGPYATLDPVSSAMLDAWLRWRAARDEWARAVELSQAEAGRLVPVRPPFIGN